MDIITEIIYFIVLFFNLVFCLNIFDNTNDKFKSLKSKVRPKSMPGFNHGIGGINKEDIRPSACVPITVPLCKNIGYNLTYMPNEFQHETQEEAGLIIYQFNPLIEINCSSDLQLFLCSMYVPICIPNWSKKIRACRSLCESARDSCLPVMKRYDFKWPNNIDCNKLTNEGACLKRDKKSERRKKPGCNCGCRHPFIYDNRAQYNTVFTGRVANCLQSCHHASFVNIDKTFVTFWLGLWSILCCCSSTATLLTFLLDRTRFQYPERPIVFLSGCYAMVSLGFLIRVIMGHESIACDQYPSTSSLFDNPSAHSVSTSASAVPVSFSTPPSNPFNMMPLESSSYQLRYGTTGPARCSIVFLLIYFFGMAASVWWVILSLTWFLSAGLKWGSEAISKYSEIFHFLAWFLPGIKSLLALTFVAIDGDPVSGICYIGNTNKLHLQLFVIVPLTIYLLLGAGFLLAGFVSLIGIRQTIRAKGQAKTDRLEKLMLRIGIFGVLYCLPAGVVIGCHLYELRGRDHWQAQINCVCSTSISSDSTDAPEFSKIAPPEYSIFMLKYFMCLVVGITSGFWIWTSKTLDSWYNAFKKLKYSNRSSHNQNHNNINIQQQQQQQQYNNQRPLLKDMPPSGYPLTSHIDQSMMCAPLNPPPPPSCGSNTSDVMIVNNNNPSIPGIMSPPSTVSLGPQPPHYNKLAHNPPTTTSLLSSHFAEMTSVSRV